jgi:hypothetical protein
MLLAVIETSIDILRARGERRAARIGGDKVKSDGSSEIRIPGRYRCFDIIINIMDVIKDGVYFMCI